MVRAGSRSEKNAPVVVTHVVKVNTYADGKEWYLPTCTYLAYQDERIPHGVGDTTLQNETDSSFCGRAGKIVVERAIITGLRPGTVKSNSDNIAKAPNVPT